MKPVEFTPAADLADYVAAYWGLAVPADARPGTSWPLPADGCISIIAQQPHRGAARALLVGPRVEPLGLPLGPADCLWGVRFWPDAGGLVLGEDPEALAGHLVSPLEKPKWAAELLGSLAECRRGEAAAAAADLRLGVPIAAAEPVDEAVRAAVRALIVTHGDMPIADVATGTGLSLRQLERRFLSAVGLNPIQYAKLRRMKGGALPMLGGAPLAWPDVVPLLESARP